MRWLPPLLPVAVVVGVALGATWAVLPAILVGLAVGTVAAVLVRRVEDRRTRELAARINGWMGDRPFTPVSLPPGEDQRALEVAINALGAEHRGHADRLRRERPWRGDLVDALVDPALLFDGEGRLLAVNDDARRELGLPDAVARPTLVQALGNASLARAAQEALTSGRRTEVEATVGERELRCVASPVGDELLVVVRDLTRQRRIEQLRRDFVVNASHELKTPAAGIQALTDALPVVVERDPARARQVADRLRSESDRLVRIVADLLDLGRLESPATADVVGTVDLAAVARAVVGEVADAAAARRVDVAVDAPDHALIGAVAEEVRLIVDNLVRNAVQYSDAGDRVVVRVRRSDGAHELVVSDTGIGIPQAALPRIFERFYRVDADRSRERGGTGLGLSIVRHAVDRLGGTITVDSLLGEGTTVTVRLPIAAHGR